MRANWQAAGSVWFPFEELAEADARLQSHTISLGYALNMTNEQIDEELGREYGNDHEELYEREKQA